MPNPIPRVFTIPASAPFVPTLIRALIDGTLVPGFPTGHDTLALAGATLYLPTRRACRLVRDVFLDVTGAGAAILPRIVPIGDVDEDEIAFAQAATGALAAAALDLPTAIGGLERRLLLAQLVLKWAGSIAPDKEDEAPLVASNPASALALADDLARLMDDMTTRGVSWNQLDELVNHRTSGSDPVVSPLDRQLVPAQAKRAVQPVAQRVEHAIADSAELGGNFVRD